MVLEIVSIALSVFLSGVSIFIAIKAYKQGTKQIEISNKQSLFKERTKAFTLLNNLCEIYENNKHMIKDSAETPDFIFCFLTGNKFLEDTAEIMFKPLSSKEQNYFLCKMEELRDIALQIELLWGNEESKMASSFISQYVELLCNLYKQQVYVKKLEERKDFVDFKTKTKKMTNDIGLDKAIRIIEDVYKKIKEKDVLNKLKEQIKLK